MRTNRGVTLIELLAIVVTMAAAGTILTSMYIQLPRATQVDEQSQHAAQLAQQCSERILSRRRSTAVGAGFASIASGMCAGLPVLPGYAVADTATPLAGGACPALANCLRIVVTVTRSAVTVAATDFIVVQY